MRDARRKIEDFAGVDLHFAHALVFLHAQHGLSLELVFFFNDTATTEIYTLSLHDALPICARRSVERMDFRHLGTSGLRVSEISYGNWLTHGSQVEEEQAHACVHRALEEGITTFDTADVYANTRAESVLGRALEGQRRESVEIFTKVFWP